MKKNFIITVLLAATALASCNITDITSQNAPEVMSIAPILQKMQTKAIYAGTFPTSGTLMLSADVNANTGNSTGANYFTGLSCSYGSSVWTPSPTHYWPLQGGLDMLGYWCDGTVTPSWTQANSVSLTFSDLSSNDLLVGAKVNVTAASKNITFKHALCKAQVKAVTASGTPANVIRINAITLKFKKGATIVITNTKSGSGNTASVGTPTLSGSATENSVASGLTQNVTATATQVGNSILFPAQTPSEIKITYQISNNGSWSSQMVTTKSISQACTAGNSYTYTLTFTLNGITVTADLTDWAADTNVSVGIPS